MRQGNELFRAGRFADAAARYATVRQEAFHAREPGIAARATGNLGGCEFALHQYQAALTHYLDARKLAGNAGDTNALAATDANIASVYSETGQLEAAARWMQGTLERVTGRDRRKHLARLLIQMATIRARQDRLAEALGLFRRGIEEADRNGDLDLYATGWNRLGEELLKKGDFPAAEQALLEAYRVRKLHHLALDSSYRNLGRLRQAQGQLASASALLDRAVELAERPQGLMPTWDIYHSRARVRLAQGRIPEALQDARVAVRLARAWRWSAPADDAARIGAEGMLEQVHSVLIEAGNRLYLHTGDPDLIRETFEAAEENRAASLRTLLGEDRGTAPELPPSFWEALSRLQKAEVAALRGVTGTTRQELEDARSALMKLDTALGPAATPARAQLLPRIESALDSDSAILSFELGDSGSWLWAVDRQGVALYGLPPRASLEKKIQDAHRAIREDLDSPASAELYRTLFAPLGERFQRKKRWLLALDRALFEVPFAALNEAGGKGPVYLAEKHSTEIIPGGAHWVEARGRRNPDALSPLWVGLGDAIYNTADPRLKAAQPRSFWSFFDRRVRASAMLPLPRLAASGMELDACARAWNGESSLFTGAGASRRTLAEQLRRNPAVVHVAAHVLASPGRPGYGVIALSLNHASETELVSPQEIAHWRVRTGLVVLSGCHSGSGPALPGTGLMGLTRAWLAAGANAVISSRWTTPDEEGALFSRLYRNLRARPRTTSALALQQAQVEMIHSGGWRARPGYWGAYFLIGNE